MLEKTLYTVVVADDEDELRDALCQMIPWETLGFRLVGNARNGLDALELVEQLEPDLLLTDIRMPFISGIELARQVREIRPSMHIAFLSGYDDFEYAKQAIQYNIISYMLKPVTLDGISREMTRIRAKMDAQFEAFQMQTQLQVSRDNFLMPLLLDEPGGADEAQLAEDAAAGGILASAADKPSFVVLVTCLYGENGENHTRPALVHSVEMIAAKYLHHASFFACGRVVTLLQGNPSDFEEYLHILTNELTQMTERVLHRHCRLGISGQTDKLSMLHSAYREALDAMSYSGEDETDIHYSSDLRQLTPGYADKTTDIVARVEAAFKAGDKPALDAALEEMTGMAQGGQYGKPWLDITALQLISSVYRILYAMGGSEAMADLQNRALLPEMNLNYRSVAQLRASLGEFCGAGMELLATQQKRGGSLLCSQALDAIAESYADETLSLVSLSSRLHVSPNHLSACIKKYTGDTFINILIGRRMDAAKSLLLTTPLKIQEIAGQCGYSDQHYFSYCFKKYCGVSPNQMRRQTQGEQEAGL